MTGIIIVYCQENYNQNRKYVSFTLSAASLMPFISESNNTKLISDQGKKCLIIGGKNIGKMIIGRSQVI